MSHNETQPFFPEHPPTSGEPIHSASNRVGQSVPQEISAPTSYGMDHQQFETFYADFAPTVQSFFEGCEMQPELVEDLSQDVFLGILRRGGVARTTDDLKTYTMVTARNRLADHYKSAATRYERLLPAMIDNETLRGRYPSPEEELYGDDATTIVASWIHEMTMFCEESSLTVEKYLKTLHYAAGELAVHLGQNSNSVKQLRLRRRRRIRQLARQGLISAPDYSMAPGSDTIPQVADRARG